VEPWDEGLWLELVGSVAYHVVDQKFRQIGTCREALLGTGEGLIVEATRGDSRCGIGLDPGDARIQCPSDFGGTHVLGRTYTTTIVHYKDREQMKT